MAKRQPKPAASLFERRSKLFFATNRANVLPVLSSGLIRSRGAYEKYYDDLLQLCPGRVPIWFGGFPESLLPLLTGGVEGMFPVLAEIDPKAVPNDQGFFIASDLSVHPGGESKAPVEAICQATTHPIPIAAVKSLRFRKQEELEDFKAREFENIAGLPPLEVSPTLFLPGGPPAATVSAALRAIPAAPDAPDRFRMLDSAMGAIAMLSLLVPTSRAWLNDLASAVAYSAKPGSGADGVPPWLSSTVFLLLSPNAPQLNGAGVNDRVGLSALDILRRMSPREGFVEGSFAAEVADRASVGASPQEQKEIAAWRDVVTAVAKSDKQAGPLDDSGSLVRRALMLFALRSQPQRLIRAPETPLNPGPGVTALAGLFAGAFLGYSRLHRDIKVAACPLPVLSKMAASWFVGEADAANRPAVSLTNRPAEQLQAKVAILVDKVPFVERTFKPSDAMMRLYYHAKTLGYVLSCDPNTGGFVHESKDAQGRQRRVMLEPGQSTARGQSTIRLRTICAQTDGRPIRLSRKEDAIALLERNHAPEMQCRYSVNPVTGNVEVIAHQLLETMDSPELQAHADAVTQAAEELEKLLAERKAATSKPSEPRQA